MQGHYCYKFSNFALTGGGGGCYVAAVPGLGSCRAPEEEEEKRGGERGRQAGKRIHQNPLTAQDEAWTRPKGSSGRLERGRLGGGYPPSPCLSRGRKTPEPGVSYCTRLRVPQLLAASSLLSQAELELEHRLPPPLSPP